MNIFKWNGIRSLKKQDKYSLCENWTPKIPIPLSGRRPEFRCGSHYIQQYHPEKQSTEVTDVQLWTLKQLDWKQNGISVNPDNKPENLFIMPAIMLLWWMI